MKLVGKILGLILLLNFNAYAWNLGKYGTFEFVKMGKNNVWIMHGPPMEPNRENKGFMNNPAFIESRKGLIVIDPGGNYYVGKKVLEEIEKASKKPVIAVMNTHKHGDHWFGNTAISEKYSNIPIYAHPNMIKEVKAGEADKWYGIIDRLTNNMKGTKPYHFPDHELKDGQTLDIDGEHFTIRHPKKAHTDTDILIIHENSKTIFLGDNVMKYKAFVWKGCFCG